VRLILKNTDGNILITREHRSEQGGFDYRLPGGKVFDTLAEYLVVRNRSQALETAVFKAALVEAKEEAGIETIENL
jgi:hypothetical protein